MKGIFANRKLSVLVLAVCMVVMAAVPAFAADGAVLNLDYGTLFSGIVGEISAAVTAVLPLALGVLAAILAIRYGIRFFRSMGS